VRFHPIRGRTDVMSGLLRRVGATLVLVTGMVGAIPATPPASAATSQVMMGNLRFDPARVEIALGDSVIWEALDDGHTVTARDGSFDSSSRGAMEEGDEYRYRFRFPGTFAYFCRIHQNRGMEGEIVVIDPYATTTSTTRLTPVTAAVTTTTMGTTTTTVPPTTTSRVLATSSSTSPAIATSTTARVGTPVSPQEPPAINPAAPVVGSAEADANLPGAQAAAERSEAKDDFLPAIALGVVVILALFGGVVGVRARRRRAT
jgi:plastocyanin